MFERFTEHAKQVTVLAQEEARLAGRTDIWADHLFLGVLSNKPGAGFHLLEHLGIDAVELRDLIRTKTGRGSGALEHLEFTPEARKALELALREALRLGDNYIGSEHLVLALVRQGSSEGARALLERGIGLPEAEAGLTAIAREGLPSSERPRRRWLPRRG